MNLYGVYDKRAMEFTGIFTSENNSTATRAFSQSAKNVPPEFLSDYELHMLGVWTSATGCLAQELSPSGIPVTEFVVALDSLVDKPTNQA